MNIEQTGKAKELPFLLGELKSQRAVFHSMLEKVVNESTYLEKGILPPKKKIETGFLEEIVADSEARAGSTQIEPRRFIIPERTEAIQGCWVFIKRTLELMWSSDWSKVGQFDHQIIIAVD